MTAISEVIAPICRSSRPRKRLALDEPISATRRRLGRTVALELDETEAGVFARKEVVCPTRVLGGPSEASVAVGRCVGPAWKF